MKLTDRILASGASLTDLIHIVITGDTSQNPAGSSYKIPMSAYVPLFGGGGSSDTYWISGSTWNGANFPIKANNDSGLDATGDYAVSVGYATSATGVYSYAEGSYTLASGDSAHAEGSYTTAIGNVSHAGGVNSVAIGVHSFVHGSGSTANGVGTIVLGDNITGATNNTTFVETLALVTVRDYANDGAADADTTLPTGGLYTTSGTTGRIVYRKP